MDDRLLESHRSPSVFAEASRLRASLTRMTSAALMTSLFSLVVIGGGNAALCAAMTARRGGASMLLLEAAPDSMRGGNSRHTRDIRYMHDRPTRFVTGSDGEEEFREDLERVTGGQTHA